MLVLLVWLVELSSINSNLGGGAQHPNLGGRERGVLGLLGLQRQRGSCLGSYLYSGVSACFLVRCIGPSLTGWPRFELLAVFSAYSAACLHSCELASLTVDREWQRSEVEIYLSVEVSVVWWLASNSPRWGRR